MHYAFDAWMDREHPGITFARYVDDVVVHATTLGQAERLRSAIAKRMVEVGLMLHPVKTKIVYCQDDNRRGTYEHESFTFLGFTFRARGARNKHGVIFASFLPAVSREALKAMGQRVRRWRIHLQISSNLADLARWMNPIVRGWMQYYGRFYRTELHPLLKRINTYLMRWARKKYKRLRTWKRFKAWWRGLTEREPELFAHWAWMRAYRWTG